MMIWCNLVLHIYLLFLFSKNFSYFSLLPYFPTLAHTARTALVLDFPFIFPFFLNIYPRQQGWLASTIPRSLVCNLLSNTHGGLSFSSFAHFKKCRCLS